MFFLRVNDSNRNRHLLTGRWWSCLCFGSQARSQTSENAESWSSTAEAVWRAGTRKGWGQRSKVMVNFLFSCFVVLGFFSNLCLHLHIYFLYLFWGFYVSLPLFTLCFDYSALIYSTRVPFSLVNSFNPLSDLVCFSTISCWLISDFLSLSTNSFALFFEPHLPLTCDSANHWTELTLSTFSSLWTSAVSAVPA